MKKILFGLAIVFGMSGVYGEHNQASRNPYSQQWNSHHERGVETIRVNVRYLPHSPERMQRISTPEGADEFDRQLMHGMLLHIMRVEGIYPGDDMDEEDYSNLFLFHNSVATPEDQIRSIIETAAPGELVNALVFRIECDREGEYARALMNAALELLSEEEKRVFMSRLRSDGALDRLGH